VAVGHAGNKPAGELMNEQQLRKAAERLIKAGKMPSLEELCKAVLETRMKFAPKIRRARREMKMECFDHVLAYMKKEGLSLDVETYCSLNYSMTWAVVEEDYPEYREEVLDLISEGELCWVQ
jgi:hypothetical protein